MCDLQSKNFFKHRMSTNDIQRIKDATVYIISHTLFFCFLSFRLKYKFHKSGIFKSPEWRLLLASRRHTNIFQMNEHMNFRLFIYHTGSFGGKSHCHKKIGGKLSEVLNTYSKHLYLQKILCNGVIMYQKHFLLTYYQCTFPHFLACKYSQEICLPNETLKK